RSPDRALVEAARRSTPFVVVTDLFLTETAEFANLILPVCSAFEKTGTTTDLAGDVLPVVGAVRAPDGVIADGAALVLLAAARGAALPPVAQIEHKVHELVRTPPAFAPDAAPPDALPAPQDGELRVI